MKVNTLGVVELTKHFIETYETEEEVLKQIEKLKSEGYSESDMYVMARKDGQLSMVKGQTNIDHFAWEGNWMDRFTSFLTGNEQTDIAFKNMGLTEQEQEKYYQDLEDGRLLLYVNKDYEERFNAVEGDAFELGEKEKTELQNRKKQSEESRRIRVEQEEAVGLDDRHYEDKESKKD